MLILLWTSVLLQISSASSIIELRCNPNFDVQTIVNLPYRCINGLSCFFENYNLDGNVSLYLNFDEANYGLDCIGFSKSSIGLLPKNLFNKYRAVNSLYASGVDLTELPSNTFENATKMLDMNLSGNKLKKLEANIFSPCKYVRKIILSQNEISEIDMDAFDGAENLEDLDLSFNVLSNVPHKAFAQLKSLRNLNLANNSFVVRYGQFPESLVTLDLSYNKLENFTLKSIISLTHLKYLYLNGNRIFRFRQHIFPEGIFETLKSLKHIQLSDNEFFCTTLADIIIWLEKHKIKVDVEPHLIIINSSNILGVGCKEETRFLV